MTRWFMYEITKELAIYCTDKIGKNPDTENELTIIVLFGSYDYKRGTVLYLSARTKRKIRYEKVLKASVL